jgi:hypothetical protein
VTLHTALRFVIKEVPDALAAIARPCLHGVVAVTAHVCTSEERSGNRVIHGQFSCLAETFILDGAECLREGRNAHTPIDRKPP